MDRSIFFLLEKQKSSPNLCPKFNPNLPEFCPDIARILLEYRQILPELDTLAKWGKGGTLPLPPPPRLISLWLPIAKKKKNSDGPIDQPIGIGVN